jgi:hypothetical protein
LRGGIIQDGPPGDAFTATAEGIRFAQGKHWVRIQSKGAPEDLVKRVAASISRRMGPPQPKPPSLISHFPKIGFDASSLKYFPSVETFRSYSDPAAAKSLNVSSDAEIAEARYTGDNQSGLMFLLKFPTIQVAEEYFQDLPLSENSGKDAAQTYVKRAGPIVAILKGPFAASFADKVLSSLRYGYSVQWIFERRKKPGIIWGIPVGILDTFVKSLFFVSLLCVTSIFLGIIFALCRFTIRNRLSRNAPDQPERTDITRLRLR